MGWLAHCSRRALIGGIALAQSGSLTQFVQAADTRRGGDAALEVHKAICPAGHDGEDYFGDCHSNGGAGYVFSLAGPGGRREAITVVAVDPGPGVVRFQHLRDGVYKLTETPQAGTSSTAFRVFCFQGVELIPVKQRGEGIAVKVAAGESLICDWYNVPPA
jgi:hypothetical protein